MVTVYGEGTGEGHSGTKEWCEGKILEKERIWMWVNIWS